mmetsp:Transcript_36566/g.53682  ORF Transcript_36566/g.53682 Transcript_36566/m.53682 type:complete len:437 (+) Transcript_36566:59-1369(+)
MRVSCSFCPLVVFFLGCPSLWAWSADAFVSPLRPGSTFPAISTCVIDSKRGAVRTPLWESFPMVTSRNKISKGSTTSLSSMALPMNNNNGPRQKLRNLLKATTKKVQNSNEVSKWRAAALVFLSSICIFRPQIDTGLVNLWEFLQHGTSLLPRMFRHDHWEWGLAVTAFFVWIHAYYFIDRSILKRNQRGGPDHRWRKFRLQDQYELEKYNRRKQLRLSEGKEFNAKAPKTNLHKWHWQAWIFEVPLYIVPLMIWDIKIPRRAAKIAVWSAPTTLQICRDVSLGLIVYDLGFFVFHYFFHKVPLAYKLFHKKHHTSTEVRACDQVRLSGVEEIVDVGISILTLNYLRAHPVSRTIYNIIITFLLTELHSGYAFPWSPQEVVPFGLATGSKGHHYHHRNGRHYYQKFFCTVDRLFGFVEKKKKSAGDRDQPSIATSN